MKKLMKLGAISLTFFFLQSCTKEDDSTPNTPDPNETKSYVAYVDGIKFQPPIANVYIDTNRDGNLLVKQLIASVDGKSIKIQFLGEMPGVYPLTGGTTGYENASYSVGADSNWVCTASAGGGNLVITKYDKPNNKISGTFNFKGKIFGTSNIKNITEGVFFDVEIR